MPPTLFLADPPKLYGRAHFNGDWTADEQRLLRSVIADVDTLLATSAPKTRASAQDTPWVFYCKRLSTASAYIAYHPLWDEVLHAKSVVELGLEILQLVEGRRPRY